MKNDHMTHIEDLVITHGAKGAKQAWCLIEDICSFANGGLPPFVTLSTKYDGSPSVIVGNHPKTREFFVATKSLFNKSPVFYNSVSQIRSSVTDPVLAGVLEDVFEACKGLKLNRTILQGDVLYSKSEGCYALTDRNNALHVLTKQNTLFYGEPLGKGEFINAENKATIAFHTQYFGKTMEDLRGEPCTILPILKKELDGKGLIMLDPVIRKSDIKHGMQQFYHTPILVNIHRVKTILNDGRIEKSWHDCIGAYCETELGMKRLLMRFINYNVKNGKRPYKHCIDDFALFCRHQFIDKESKLVSKKGIENNANVCKQILSVIENNQGFFNDLFEIHTLLYNAKLNVVQYLDNNVKREIEAYEIDTDIIDKVGPAEGYVVSHYHYHSVKLVNRLQFSKNNFKTVRK